MLDHACRLAKAQQQKCGSAGEKVLVDELPRLTRKRSDLTNSTSRTSWPRSHLRSWLLSHAAYRKAPYVAPFILGSRGGVVGTVP